MALANTKRCRWYKKQNHIRLPKYAVTPKEVTSVVPVQGKKVALGADLGLGVSVDGDAFSDDDGLPAKLTHSRSGTATYLDSNGVLQTAADGVARTAAYRYIDGVLTGPSLRLESVAATNLITHSEDFTNASWSKSGTPALAIDATGPDGETSAVTLIDDSSGGTGNVRVFQAVSLTPDTEHSFTIYLKEDQLSWALVQFNGLTNSPFAYINLATGALGTTGGTARFHVEEVGAGWYRCGMSFDPGADGDGSLRIWAAESDNNITVDLDGTSSILIFGAQREEGPIPTSYIATSGATATRSAETLTIAAADMPAYTDAACFQMSGTMNYADTGEGLSSTGGGGVVLFYLWGSGTNFLQSGISGQTARVGQTVFSQREGASGLDIVEGEDDDYSPGLNVSFNIASRHGSSFINGAVNGTALTEDTTPTAIADLSAVDLDVGPNFNGHIDQLLIWNQDIGDTGIAEASQ